MFWLLLVGLARAAPPPSDATLVYYNARMALREGHSVEAVELWLLRNALRNRTGRVSTQDADFRSVAWAALGDLGLCQDGFAKDTKGAGLWPLALHNQVVRNLGRQRPPPAPDPFGAFEVDRQQRRVAIMDVLGSKELATVKLARSRCVRPWYALLAAGESATAKLNDRQVAARVLRSLIVRAKDSLGPHVRGRAVLDARLFDIDLQLASLAAREARTESRKAAYRGRELGLSRPSVAAMREEAPKTTLDPGSSAAQVLRDSLSWPIPEWMSLSSDRRLFLFTQARTAAVRPGAFDEIGLAIVDQLAAQGDGSGIAVWIGLLAAGEDPARRRALWDGPRGGALLALGDETGFGERGVIALHRGIDELERGRLDDALRSLAFARQHAEESRASEELAALSLRWLTYVAGRFAVTAELLVTLQELVPRQDYAVILEDLLWTAAFHADRSSFDVGLAHQRGRGALERRLSLLGPLAAGDGKLFNEGIRAGLAESPSETLRFLDQLVQRLEREDATVRRAHVPTLSGIRSLLAPLTDAQGSASQGRTAGLVLERARAIADGVGGLPESMRDRARAVSPDDEVYAGSIRLAPADPPPWPFAVTDPAAPSVFTPIELVPEERPTEDGGLVFGWSIRG